jgi:hypothetical protein
MSVALLNLMIGLAISFTGPAFAQTPDPELTAAALHSCQASNEVYNNNDLSYEHKFGAIIVPNLATIFSHILRYARWKSEYRRAILRILPEEPY